MVLFRLQSNVHCSQLFLNRTSVVLAMTGALQTTELEAENTVSKKGEGLSEQKF